MSNEVYMLWVSDGEDPKLESEIITTRLSQHPQVASFPHRFQIAGMIEDSRARWKNYPDYESLLYITDSPAKSRNLTWKEYSELQHQCNDIERKLKPFSTHG